MKELEELLSEGNPNKIAEYMNNNGLTLKEGKIVYKDKEIVKKQIEYWDKRQLVKKINLNS